MLHSLLPRTFRHNFCKRTLLTNRGYVRRLLCEIANPRPSTKQQSYGVLLDIDGVLIRGRKAIPGAKEALGILEQSDVPTVFLTNAGCQSEKATAESVSDKIGFQVKEEQMVLSHSPLKMLDWLHDKHVLLSGQGPVKDILTGYGFTNVSDIEDVRRAYPLLDVVDRARRFQFDQLGQVQDFPPVEAILLLGEPIRWETNLQLIIDFLVTNGKLSSSSSSLLDDNIPVIAANTDLLYMSEAPLPRFAHGAFIHCLESIYKKLTGQELMYTLLLGKPYLTNYQYAEYMLHQLRETTSNITRLYAVGDNLDTDIYGANMCHEYLQVFHEKGNSTKEDRLKNFCSYTKLSVTNWNPEIKSVKSILVQTGVSSPSASLNQQQFLHHSTVFNPELRKANYVVKDVVEAVELILKRECR